MNRITAYIRHSLQEIYPPEEIKALFTMEKAGTIADAAVELSGVFQAAQEAADTYLKSIKAKEKELAHLIKQAKKNMRD